MGLNTCREQWKEQRKQNKIEKSENTAHKLSQDAFTLQMQAAATADKPGWTPVPSGQSTQWQRSDLSYQPQGILRHIPVPSRCGSASASSEVPLTPPQKRLFPSRPLNWLLAFQIILVLFENTQDSCNSNLVFRHIKPQDNLKEPCSLYRSQLLFYKSTVFLSITESKQESP